MTKTEKIDTLKSRADWLSHALNTSGEYPHRRFHQQELDALEWAIKRITSITDFEESFIQGPVTFYYQKPRTPILKRLFFSWGLIGRGLGRLLGIKAEAKQ